MSQASVPSLAQAVDEYLSTLQQARSANTARTYAQALRVFLSVLKEQGLEPQNPVTALREDAVLPFLKALHHHAPSTERLYLTAVLQFYTFLVAHWDLDLNLVKVRQLVRQHARRPGVRLPQFPYRAIEQLLETVDALARQPARKPRLRLQNLRDRAFLWTLAHTGLRVHEACALRRGDVDWETGHALIVGKGNRQDVVRFSARALQALREYLQARQALDARSGRPLRALPLFARHDKRAGRRVLPISTVTGRNIVRAWVRRVLGPEMEGRITPHAFRHYFVTRVLKDSGGNLKLAQRLARHRNIAVTQRYAHLSDAELDAAYRAIFEEGQDRTMPAQ